MRNMNIVQFVGIVVKNWWSIHMFHIGQYRYGVPSELTWGTQACELLIASANDMLNLLGAAIGSRQRVRALTHARPAIVLVR
jgi:hypothetical protein